MRWLLTRLGLVALAVMPCFSASPAFAQPVPGTSCALFPADNVLNTDIGAQPVNAMSETWKGNMAQNPNLHPDLGTFAQWYGIPVNVAPPPATGVAPTFAYDSESDHPTEGYPIDQNTFIEGGPAAPSGSDRHALVINQSNCKLYEIYNLQNFTNGQTPSAGSGAVWDLASNAMRPAGWTSADAAGLPITPLLLRPDEILAGSITHAIRFTTHCTYSYIWPASHDAGLCGAGFPPMGARFRLRSSFNLSSYSANTQVVLRAFQHYGLVLADNGSDWYFQGSTNDWWGTAAGSQVESELKTIPASQFDAVDESRLQIKAGSYQASPYGGQATSFVGAPAVGTEAVNQLDLVGVGRDRQVWNTSWNGTAWARWQPQGGVAIGDPAAVSTGVGKLDIFVRGQDNALWHRALSGGTWGAWESLGGVLISGPGASTWGSGHLDVFVAGQDRALWHKAYDGTSWGRWESLGGVISSTPGAASTGLNNVAVFARGQDYQLWYRSWNGSAWSSWQTLGGVLWSGPGAASQGANLLDVFVRGQDEQLWHRSWNGSQWSTWEGLGGILKSGPSAASWGAGRLDVVVSGNDLQGYHKLWNGTVWSSWDRLLGPPGG